MIKEEVKQDCIKENNSLKSKLILEQEDFFREQHKNDNDDELIQYVKLCAEKLGRCPNKQDVVGFTYLKKRLGPWHRILEMAGLKEKSKKQLEKEQKKREMRKNKKRVKINNK